MGEARSPLKLSQNDRPIYYKKSRLTDPSRSQPPSHSTNQRHINQLTDCCTSVTKENYSQLTNATASLRHDINC
ncbi:hypothetical protein [Microcoleus sp. F4-D5]|uniref:hypothetical protein n=1 Tax=Microcoleus sp. F4-D5 TaxID=2818760 RepID=UPI002FCECDA9